MAQERILKLDLFNRVYELSQKSNETELDEYAEIWKELIILSNEDYCFIQALVPFLTDAVSKNSCLISGLRSTLDIINNIIQNREEYDFRFRGQFLSSLIPFLHLLPIDHIMKVFAVLLEFSYEESESEKGFPIKTVDIIEKIDSIYFNSHLIMSNIMVFIDQFVSTELSHLMLLIISPFAADIVEKDIKYLSLFIDNINRFLLMDSLYQQCSMYLLSFLPFSNIPTSTIEQLLPLFTSDNTLISQKSHKLARSYIESEGIDNSFLEMLITQFNSDKCNIRFFFKLVCTIIDSQDPMNMEFLSLITSFISKLQESSKVEEKKGYLDILSSLAPIFNDVIKSTHDQSIIIANSLLPHKQMNGSIAEFAFSLIKCIPNSFYMIKDTILVSLIDFLKQVLPDLLKIQLQTAGFLAAIHCETNLPQEWISVLIQFLINALDITQETKVFYACTPILSLSKFLNCQYSQIIFDKLSILLLKESKCNQMNAILHTMVSLFSNNINENSAKDVYENIVFGRIPYLNGLSPIFSRDDETMVFNYIRVFYESYPKYGNIVLQFVVASLPKSRFGLFSGFYEIIEALPPSPETGQVLYFAVHRFLSQISRTDESGIVLLSNAIDFLVKNYLTVIDTNSMLQLVAQLLFTNEEEEEELIDQNQAFLCLLNIAFQLFAISSTEIKEEFFNSFMDILPDNTIAAELSSLLSNIGLIIKNKHFSYAHVQLLSYILNFLLLDKGAMQDFGITDKMFTSLKDIFVSAIKSNRALEKKVTKGFNNQMLNKYRALFR